MAKAKKAAVIGYTAEQAQAAEKFRQTVAKNTPHEILEAFFPSAVTIRDIPLQAVDLATFMLLEKIESPLAVTASAGGAAKVSFSSLAEALLIISLDPDAAEALVADRKKFDQAVPIFARRVPASQIVEAGQKVVAQIQAAFATAIPTAAPGEKASAGSPLEQSNPVPS